MTKTVHANYTCECGETLSFVWDIDDRPDEQEALCPKCEAVVFRPPIRPPTYNGWRQFKDEKPKDGQQVWLHTPKFFAPDVELMTYPKGKKMWLLGHEYSEEAKPEDYWMPFSYPEPPKVP